MVLEYTHQTTLLEAPFLPLKNPKKIKKCYFSFTRKSSCWKI